MNPSTSRTALKEWAVTVKALEQGSQVILLRKGGISEDGKRFAVAHDQFLLFPTYAHQSVEQLKESAQEELRSIMANAPTGDSIEFNFWANVQEVLELSEKERVDALYPHHIWVRDYAPKRLRWQPKNPLSLMLLRVYRLEHPVALPYLPVYGGCKSWVQLDESVPLGNMVPVLTDANFEQKVNEVKFALAMVDIEK